MAEKKRKLTIREKKFAAQKAKGKTHAEAYVAAGYKATTKQVAVANAAKLVQKPHIQDAIDAALEMYGATPEWAVRQLMKVAEQDDEIGAKRLASKDILELHGWNKKQTPNQTLSIENAFFTNTRKHVDQVEDVDES